MIYAELNFKTSQHIILQYKCDKNLNAMGLKSEYEKKVNVILHDLQMLSSPRPLPLQDPQAEHRLRTRQHPTSHGSSLWLR